MIDWQVFRFCGLSLRNLSIHCFTLKQNILVDIVATTTNLSELLIGFGTFAWGKSKMIPIFFKQITLNNITQSFRRQGQFRIDVNLN